MEELGKTEGIGLTLTLTLTQSKENASFAKIGPVFLHDYSVA